jgi:hypothetical protein
VGVGKFTCGDLEAGFEKRFQGTAPTAILLIYKGWHARYAVV